MYDLVVGNYRKTVELLLPNSKIPNGFRGLFYTRSWANTSDSWCDSVWSWMYTYMHRCKLGIYTLPISSIILSLSVCVYVQPVGTSGTGKSSQEEPVGFLTPAAAPINRPGVIACFWLGRYYPRTLRPGQLSPFLRVPTPTYVLSPSRPGYPIQNIEAAALHISPFWYLRT